MMATGDVYVIDPGVSRFTVRAFVTGLLSKLGHSPTIAIRSYTGEARIDPEPSLWVRIDARSLAVTDRVSDRDLQEMERTMNDEVLEVGRYREVVYKTTRARLEGDRAVMEGELTLHGVTRSLPLEARVAMLGESLRAQGEFAVSQSAYGIRPVRVAGGALKLKDELKCAFEIVARRKAQSATDAA